MYLTDEVNHCLELKKPSSHNYSCTSIVSLLKLRRDLYSPTHRHHPNTHTHTHVVFCCLSISSASRGLLCRLDEANLLLLVKHYICQACVIFKLLK